MPRVRVHVPVTIDLDDDTIDIAKAIGGLAKAAKEAGIVAHIGELGKALDKKRRALERKRRAR